MRPKKPPKFVWSDPLLQVFLLQSAPFLSITPKQKFSSKRKVFYPLLRCARWVSLQEHDPMHGQDNRKWRIDISVGRSSYLLFQSCSSCYDFSYCSGLSAWFNWQKEEGMIEIACILPNYRTKYQNRGRLARFFNCFVLEPPILMSV